MIINRRVVLDLLKVLLCASGSTLILGHIFANYFFFHCACVKNHLDILYSEVIWSLYTEVGKMHSFV